LREITARLQERFAPWESATAIRLDTPNLTALTAGQFVLIGGAGWGGSVLRVPALPWVQSVGTTLDLLFTDSNRLEHLEEVLRLDRPLRLLGPAGRGFSIDGRTRRALVVGNGEGLGPLLLLTTELLRRGVDVTFVSTAEDPERHAPAAALPHEAEYLTPEPDRRLAQLEDLLPWADALYLAVSPLLLPDILTLLRRRLLRLPKSFAQALIRSVAMPCGLGACDLCVVGTTNGYRRACREGPVFDLPSLI
jgi:dihydroorotate dehydrogenase electron transfer subunit